MAARLAPLPSETSTTVALDALWLHALQRIARRSAHELKGVLNGVSVNLEVVRSRSGKADAPASAVNKFAESASQQFEEVLEMSDALLALARAVEPPVEIGSTVARMGKLLAPAAKADGRKLEMLGGYELLGASSAPAAAVRLAVAEALLGATDASAHVVCLTEPPVLRIESHDGSALGALPDEVLAVLRESGIDVQAESSVITISFPRSSGKAANA
jgi:signal transduction histidine kinase